MYKVLYFSVFDCNRQFQNNNISVITTNDVIEVYSLLNSDVIDLILIDCSSSKYSSYNIIKKILSIKYVPIWLISNALDAITYVSYTNLGVTNIIPSFDNEIVLSYLLENYFNKIMPNNITVSKTNDTIYYDKLSISKKNSSIQFIGGQAVKLQQKQLEILLYLLENAGQLVTYQKLWTHCWNEPFDNGLKSANLNTLHNQISRLRQSLSKASCKDFAACEYIQTVSNKGYKFVITS